MQGSILNNQTLANVEAHFPATNGVMQDLKDENGAYLQWQTALLLPEMPLNGYTSDNSSIDWAIANNKYTVDANTGQMKLALLSDAEMNSYGLNNGDVIGWKTSATHWRAFNSQIDWALQNKKFVIDSATGQIKFGNLTDYDRLLFQLQAGQEMRVENNAVIRNTEGAFLQTTHGVLELNAKNAIGQLVSGFEYSPLSLVVDAQKLLVSSAEKQIAAIISMSAVSVEGNSKAGSSAGSTELLTLNNNGSANTQQITNPMDAAGKDIKLVGDSVNINADIRSAGATITLHPTDNRAIIIGGNKVINNTYTITETEFSKIKDGFNEIVIGNPESNSTIAIMQSITFNDSLTLNTPMLGGEVIIDADVFGGKGADFIINGSGHTTLFNANLTTKSTIEINDSLQISGNRKISTQQGDLILGNNATHFLNGDVTGEKDSLILRTNNGDVIINAQIGTVDTLGKLTISKAQNVTFNEKVVIDGSLIIQAAGTVSFNSLVDISGNLIIRGASAIKINNQLIETHGKIFTLSSAELKKLPHLINNIVKSFETQTHYYDKASNDLFYFWTENVQL